ncbi:hypothetical protein Tco_1011717 [Tanacetum coccineum]
MQCRLEGALKRTRAVDSTFAAASTPMLFEEGRKRVNNVIVTEAVTPEAATLFQIQKTSRADTSTITRFGRESEESNGETVVENRKPSENSKVNPHETQAMAWFKQEEVKIQARVSHEKRKAEMEMK